MPALLRPPFAMQLQERAGAIKRVLRISGRNMCAICHSQFEDEREALSCLSRCWNEVLNMNPVITRRHGLETRHFCRFCARSFRERNLALGCAADCRQKFMNRFESEIHLVEAGDLPPPPRRKWRSKSQTQWVRVAPSKAASAKGSQAAVSEPQKNIQLPTVNADVKIVPMPQPSAISAAKEEAVASPAEADPAARGSIIDDTGTKKKPDKAFFRDGAEYVCTMCNKKYYTKIEVQACFDGHPG